MARIPYLNRDDLPAEHQSLLDRNINLFRALANSPEAARAFGGLGGHIRHKSTLDPRLREMAILQVGYLDRAAYEWSHHVKLATEDFGVTDEDIRALIAETEARPSGLAPLDRAVLRLAREMAIDVEGTSLTFDEVHSGLGTEHTLDLVIAIGFYCMVTRVLRTVGVDVEPDYEPYLERFPLPTGGRGSE